MSSRSRKSRKSVGRAAGGQVLLPHPQSGALGTYTTKDTAAVRRKKLERSVKTKGYATIIRDVSLRATLNKNTNPAASRKMKSDIAYLRKSRKSKK